MHARPSVNPTKIAENMVKLLSEELPFEKKRVIVRAVIEKVVATPAEATIYGRIPIFEGIGNDLISIKESKEIEENSESNNEKCKNLNFFTLGHVGYELKDRNCGVAKCGKINAF